MKKTAIILISVFVCAAFSLAGGDQLHGTKGQGSTTVGTTAPGQASQPRAGR